jgi:hypothetical protein
VKLDEDRPVAQHRDIVGAKERQPAALAVHQQGDVVDRELAQRVGRALAGDGYPVGDAVELGERAAATLFVTVDADGSRAIKRSTA